MYEIVRTIKTYDYYKDRFVINSILPIVHYGNLGEQAVYSLLLAVSSPLKNISISHSTYKPYKNFHAKVTGTYGETILVKFRIKKVDGGENKKITS